MTKEWIIQFGEIGTDGQDDIGRKERVEREKTALEEAADILRAGGVVAFPTETVYGLGADATNTKAVERVFEAKGRPSDNPLIVHVASIRQAEELAVELHELERQLMEKFWPGPLTVIVPVKPGAVSERVTCGLATVGLRMPDHPVALALIEAAALPIAAPSANRSGRPSPTRAEHVRVDLAGRIDGLVDGGATGVGLESTVVEVTRGEVHLLRPGGVTPEMLREAGFRVAAPAAADAGGGDTPPETAAGSGAAGPGAMAAAEAPRSPGMKYAHYAPQGELVLVEGGAPEARAHRIRELAAQAAAAGERTGILTYAEHAGAFAGAADVVALCGSVSDLARTARELFAALRRFDDEGVTRIIAEGCPEEGLGLAVMNRLRKAAGGRIERLEQPK
ncbi:L-threonylcarbamoyladenylate synthase [Paenibacillus turpanensis]|uniref:L-threonylcarbamoyladenylate synthase n=1 Tax=Paenibacillus turpanensis TaxID=2689078 RepID=UPI00140C563A|nr:L-threonylcarbamoyladenylate synthase [Paenibacillus turpanensis]